MDRKAFSHCNGCNHFSGWNHFGGWNHFSGWLLADEIIAGTFHMTICLGFKLQESESVSNWVLIHFYLSGAQILFLSELTACIIIRRIFYKDILQEYFSHLILLNWMLIFQKFNIQLTPETKVQCFIAFNLNHIHYNN